MSSDVATYEFGVLLQRNEPMYPNRKSQSISWDGVKSVVSSSPREFDFDRLELSPKRISRMTSSGEVFKVLCRFYRGSTRVDCRNLLMKWSPYAALEHKWLHLVNRRLRDDVLSASVPQDLGYIESQSVVITSFLSSNSTFHSKILDATLKRWGDVARDGLVEASSLVGTWLAQFHAAIDEGEKVPLSDELDEVRERIQELTMFRSAEKDRVLEIISSCSRDIGPAPVLLSHGDFTPRNLLFQDNAVRVIDWEMVHDRPRPFLFDVHYFLATFARHQGRFGLPRKTANSAMSAFIDAYRSECPRKDLIDATWKPTRLVTLVTVLSRQYRTFKRRPLLATLTGKQRFMKALAHEIRKEIRPERAAKRPDFQ